MTLVCAGLLVLLIIASSSFTVIESHPADVLPSQETVALFVNADEEILRRFEVVFPELKNVSPAPDKTIALLAIGESRVVAQIQEDTKSQTTDEQTKVGQFIVTLSDPTATSLFTDPTPRLASAMHYQKLGQQKTREEQWVYLDLSMLPSPVTLPQNILRTLMPEGSTHAAFTFSNQTTIVELFSEQAAEYQGISPVIQSAFIGERMTVRLSDVVRAWEQILSHLDDSSKNLLQGGLEQFIADTFGEEISTTYDLLPLLHGPATLHIGQNSSGALLFALEGVASSTKNVRTQINALHRGFQSMLPGTRTIQRKLDDNFTSEDIRIDQNIIKQEEREHGHWQIRRTSHEDGRTFVTASLGGTFVLANDMQSLEQILERDARIVTPTGPSLIATVRLADGYAEEGILEELFPELDKDETLLPLLPEFTGKILWSIEQRGPVTTLTVKARE